MVLIWQGNTTFKIILLDGKVIFIDPKKPVQADVILFTSEKNQIKDTGNSFIILGPGEYEVKDIFIKGLADFYSDFSNTIFEIKAEGINLLNLGVFKNSKLTQDTLSKISEIDILIVPIGKEALEAKEAISVINSLEPKIIIPINLASNQKTKNEAIENFIKEISLKSETLDKLSIKKSDLSTDEQKIIILKS